MKLPVEKCQWCGGTEFVIGYQHQEAQIMTSPNGIFGCRVRYLICKNCGAILLGQIAQPEKYKEVHTAWESDVRR